MSDYKALFYTVYKANYKAMQILRQAQREAEDMALQATDPLAMLLAMEAEPCPPLENEFFEEEEPEMME